LKLAKKAKTRQRTAGTTRPRRKKAAKKATASRTAHTLSLHMAFDGVYEATLDRTEQIRFNFEDHDSIQMACGSMTGGEVSRVGGDTSSASIPVSVVPRRAPR
jgi:hypothetical protein